MKDAENAATDGSEAPTFSLENLPVKRQAKTPRWQHDGGKIPGKGGPEMSLWRKF